MTVLTTRSIAPAVSAPFTTFVAELLERLGAGWLGMAPVVPGARAKAKTKTAVILAKHERMEEPPSSRKVLGLMAKPTRR
jgi:hypothetical protein